MGDRIPYQVDTPGKTGGQIAGAAPANDDRKAEGRQANADGRPEPAAETPEGSLPG